MEPIRLYLDNCCFNRPFDDQSQLSVRLETEAILFIQHEIKEVKVDLAWSSILDFISTVSIFGNSMYFNGLQILN